MVFFFVRRVEAHEKKMRALAIFAVLVSFWGRGAEAQPLDFWTDEVDSLPCKLFKVGCPPPKVQILVDIDSLEARLALDCRPASDEDLTKGYPHCYDRLRQDRALFRKSERTPGNPKLGGGAYRWVRDITWSGEGAVFQTYGGVQLDTEYGYWLARDFKWPRCNGATNGGNVGDACRRVAVCRMEEEVWGARTSDPGVLRPIYNYKVVTYKTTENEDANWPMLVTQQCLVCETAPCEPYSCANGKVPGRPMVSEPGFLNKVMRRQACDKDCSFGTFLTCGSPGPCAYKPASSFELSSGRSGLLAWWAYNAFQNVSGANLVHPDTTRPPVEDCYPCLFADRRTHAGVAMSTERSRAQRGFLDFFCPGGSLPPEDCPENQVSRVDPATNRSGRCGCAGGYYWSEAEGMCRLCPAGHYCAWDGLNPPVVRECPNDMYAEGGAETCRRCSVGKQCDAGQALTRCLQNGASGESGKYQREDAQCVMCAECVQLGAGADGVPCYKVSSLVAS